MHDVIIDGYNQGSSNIKNQNRKMSRPKKRRNFGRYLFDWLVKGLMLALLININFFLYASSGNFKIFSSGYTIAPEMMYIMGGVLVISIGLLFLVSFSSFLQNVLTSFIFALFVMAMMNQFALFDKASILDALFNQYFGQSGNTQLMTNSHKIITVASGLIFFTFLAMSSNQNIAYFTGVLVIVFGGMFADAYLSRNKQSDYKVTYDNKLQDEKDNGKKFIYVLLPNAASYNYIESMQDAGGKSTATRKAMDIMLAFYAENNFTMYPNAYVKNLDPFMNVVKSFNNINSKDADTYTLKSVSMDSYWQFKNINDEYVYLKDNAMFDTFRKAKYRISAYQSRGVDICKKNNEINVDKCVEKVNTPIDLKNMNISETDKTMVLSAQWINSMGLFKNKSLLYTLLKSVTKPDNLPLLGIPYNGLYVVDSLKSLDLAAEDIAKDKGNRAYFVVMDMPSDMFVYNEFCKIKVPAAWISMESFDWIVNKNLYQKRNAYMEQTECLYGKLQEFMGKLEKDKVLDNSVVIIQGLSGANDLINVKGNKDFIVEFKNKKLITMGIRDPLKKEFNINYEACSASDIVKQYLYKKDKCVQLSSLDVHDGAKKEIINALKPMKISEQQISKAKLFFDKWYKNWLRASKFKLNNTSVGFVPKIDVSDAENDNMPIIEEEAPVVEDDIVMESQPEEQIPEIEIKAIEAAKVMDEPIVISPEDKIESFVETIQKEEAKAEVKGLQEEVVAPIENEVQILEPVKIQAPVKSKVKISAPVKVQAPAEIANDNKNQLEAKVEKLKAENKFKSDVLTTKPKPQPMSKPKEVKIAQ